MTGVRLELQRGNLALPALGLVLALAAGCLWVMTDGTVYFYDEWVFIYWRLEPTAEALLEPHNGSFNLVPLLLYQGVFGAFGLDDYWVLRALTIGFVVLCSVLLFLYLRRRVAPWIAFWPAAFLPFFGAAYWIQTTSLGLLWTIPVAAGLGALIALDRGNLRADAAACLLLLVAVASHTPGLVFAVGAAVALSLRPPPERWTRAWIWGVPVVLYAAWIGRYGDGSQADLVQIWKLPEVAVESLATVLGGIMGLYRQPEAIGAARDAIETGPMVPISIILIALVIALAASRRLPRGALVGIGLALAFWAILAVGASESRTPSESRFLHIAAVTVLIPLACLLPRRRTPAVAPLVLAVVFLVGVTSNLRALSAGAEAVKLSSRWQAAGAAGVELAGDQADPSFAPGRWAPRYVAAEVYMPPSSGSYLELVEEHGSPALSGEELRRSGSISRRIADRIVTRALGLYLKSSPAGSAAAWERGGCRRRRSKPVVVSRFPGTRTEIVASPNGPAKVGVGRFSDAAVVPLGTVRAREAALLSIPRDRSRQPWRIEARSMHGVAVCAAAER